jgi:hypothetical protein
LEWRPQRSCSASHRRLPIRRSSIGSRVPTTSCRTRAGYPIRVQIDGTANDILFLGQTGALERLIGTGSFQAILTNLETGKTETLNISGPLFAEFDSDGGRTVTTRGPWLIEYRPESLASPPIVPWLYLFQGERVLRVGADSSRTVTWRGRFVDLCAVLAT